MKSTSVYNNHGKHVKEMHGVRYSIPEGLLPIMLVIFIAMDAMTIYAIIDAMFMQSEMMSLIVTLGVAVLLEGIPMVLAEFTGKKTKTSHDRGVIIGLFVLFMALVASLTWLRWNTQELMYDTGSITNITGEVSEFELSNAHKSMTILLALEPVLTSVVAYAMAVFVSVEQKQKDLQELELAKLYQELADENRALTELRQVLDGIDQMSVEDEQAFDNLLAEYNAIKNMLGQQARMILAEHLSGDADAVDRVLNN